MCGIVGRLNFTDEPVDAQTIKRMSDRLFHRGPDDEGLMIDGNLGLGFRRLAIIDLSERGHQPMSDEEGNVWLVFNGEIYNFFLLRNELEKDGVRFRSDTDSEVIIHLYKKYGVECLHHLRGMFVFAIWDKRSRTLFIARDRLGKKPLKYYHDATTFIFASELKAILENSRISRSIDHEAVEQYLTFGYVPHPRTGIVGIQKLEPAHYLLVSMDGTLKKKRYWDLNYESKLSYSVDEWKLRVRNAIEESVCLRLISDVPLGAHLSGGIDSSLVVAIMARQMAEPVKTFSIGFIEDSHNELQYARQVAQMYGTDHNEFVVEPKAAEILPQIVAHLEEPFADPAILPTWYLSRLSREHVTIALNGDGGDENFAGYARYQAMRHYYNLRRFHPILTIMRRPLIRMMRNRRNVLSVLSAYDFSPYKTYLNLIQIFPSAGCTHIEPLFEASRHLDWRDQLMSVDVHSYLPDDLLTKADMMSMAHSLEMRSPFLDYEFMELIASMPSDLKLSNRTSKFLLKEIAREYLPSTVVDRTKKGFTIPHTHWLRTSLNTFLKEVLAGEALAPWGFNDATIYRLIEEHERGIDHGTQLWTLLMLGLWVASWRSNPMS